MFDLKTLFHKDAIIRYLKEMPVIKTSVMDTFFTDRPQNPLPIVGVDWLWPVVTELPLVRRGAPSISTISETGAIQFYEPYPLRPKKEVSAMDLNNLQLLPNASRENWASTKTDYLRRAVRKTCEAMCSVVLSGTLTWPVKLEGGGYENYQVAFGNPLTVTPGTAWDDNAAKLKDPFETLQAMKEKIAEYGYGSDLEIWAGSSAYSALFALAEAHVSKAKFTVNIDASGINVGGYLVKRMVEKYTNPQTGSAVDKLGEHDVLMIDKSAGHRLVYSAIDDLDANLLPMPFFVKPVKTDDPSGWKLIADCKPFPIPNLRAICFATVTS
ncbi:MAG: major capsid protein [Desulforhopalus sp.]|jgi:hypothetical protein|nr:major capsid protein [Desulforhopalus sp.]